MSNFKRATVAGGAPRKDVLGTLREAQILSFKLALPVEILSLVLEFLTPHDQIRFACTSRRMRDMVYDDARWVRKLKLMGCWNEAAAAARKDEATSKRNQARRPSEVKRSGEVLPKGVALNGLNTSISSHPKPRRQSSGFQATATREIKDDGFDFASLSPTVDDYSPVSGPPANNTAALDVLKQARSIRSGSRQEYGRIHNALGPYYRDAVRSKQPASARVFRAYRDPEQQAQMLNQLARFAKADTAEDWESRGRKVEELVEAFEEAMTGELDAGFKAGDVDGRIRKYSRVLVTLNGGRKAVEQFVVQNTIFEESQKIGDPMDCVSPTNPDIIYLIEVQSFFKSLADACNRQIAIAERAFPESVDAITPFLQKVGKDIIDPYVSTLLNCLHERSTESYVRAVSGTYEQALRFTKSLQLGKRQSRKIVAETLNIIILNSFAQHIETYFKEELEFFTRNSDAEVSSWERRMVEQDASLESMFMSSVNRQADKRDFLSSFKKVVMMPVNVLPAFPMSNPFAGGSSRAAASKAIANGENHDSSSQPSSSHPNSRPGTPNTTGSQHPQAIVNQSEAPTTELAAKAAIMKSRLEGIGSLFSLEVALNLVHMAKASIERCAIFTRSITSTQRNSTSNGDSVVTSITEDEDNRRFETEAKAGCEAVFLQLLRTLGTRHVKAGFDQAVQHLSRYNPRAATNNLISTKKDNDVQPAQPGIAVAPLVMFLELVNVGDLIQQMLDVFFEQELVATRLTDRNDFLNPAAKEKKRFEQMLDERVAAGLNKGIEVLMAEVEFIAATTQDAEDYNPGGSAANGAGDEAREKAMMDISTTQTAVRIVEVVSAHTRMLVGSTDKNVLDVFNQEVGLRLFATVCKHLKRQRISVAGSLRLISDTNLYFSYIQTLKNKDLLQYFVALRELVQIYLISPDDAKELAVIIADNDRFKGIFRAEEVYEYAERRADWYQVKGRVEKAMYGIGCVVM